MALQMTNDDREKIEGKPFFGTMTTDRKNNKNVKNID